LHGLAASFIEQAQCPCRKSPARLFAVSPNDINSFILSPNDADATVILDGSRSSDVDNDPLEFFWYADGQTNVLATGAFFTNLLALGPHTVRLVVSDGHDTGTALISFEIITAGTAVGQFALWLDEANLGPRNKQPLLVSLSAVLASLDRGNPKAGLNQLAAFQNKVRAQMAPINPTLAEALVRAAKNIMDSVNGTATGPGD